MLSWSYGLAHSSRVGERSFCTCTFCQCNDYNLLGERFWLAPDTRCSDSIEKTGVYSAKSLADFRIYKALCKCLR